MDKQADRRESSLWVMNADGSKNRFLVRGSSARWSPTGDRIVYTAQGEPRGSQIFVRYMDAEGAVSQITRVEKSPSGVAWSPDGTRIGFTMNVEAKNVVADQDAARARRRQAGSRRRASSSGSTIARTAPGSTTTRYRHIFVVPATGGTPRQLTNGNWNHNGVEWTPDGKQILFGSTARRGRRIPVARVGDLCRQRRQRRHQRS